MRYRKSFVVREAIKATDPDTNLGQDPGGVIPRISIFQYRATEGGSMAFTVGVGAASTRDFFGV